MTAFPSIRLEGGLLGPDVLDQLLAADLPGQKPADFGLDAKRNLTDEIAAIFTDSCDLWRQFQNRLKRLKEDDPATSVTRDAWVVPFLSLLGYELRYNSRAYEVDGLTFAISHRAGVSEDSPPVHIVGVRQELGRVPPSGRPRLAPHSLVQEFLNRQDHTWGLVTNGCTLRLLRDSTYIRRQAYIELDLEALLEEQRFQDFVALYRLLHRTRLPRGLDDAGDCLLEKYHAHSEEQGGRVREHLREGVEECLKLLANGFLRHRDNGELRRRVSRSYTGNDRITPEDLYRQLLRLVYRFLFLLVSEDRGLLSLDPLYREHYGVGRLRRLLDQRSAFTDHGDLWQSLRVLWWALSEEKFSGFLHLTPLNGELFSHLDLDDLTLTNGDLLEAFWYLAFYQEGRSKLRRRVNYAALDVEELGSVYESLLEFHPTVQEDGTGRPVFDLITGTERKATGSYYTPPALVAELVKSALEPVLADRLAARPQEKDKAILSIRVCDPACGSGHFLLAAARRLGKELARVRTGEDEPAPERVREAIREVISHCIYGVDKNPLAVDLCRVALWLESHTGDKPLTFLDHRIRLGDSLVGVFDLATLAEGIPDKAFTPLEGDDKDFAREVARLNRDQREGQMGLFTWSPDETLAELTRQSREIDAIADDSPEAIRRKKLLYEMNRGEPESRRQEIACDLWTAAFFQPLVPENMPIASGVLAQHLAGEAVDPRLIGEADDLAFKFRFFHWQFEFPEVFAEGGFDVVLSNPPWERVKLQEQEFFATRDISIANAPNKAARARLINELPEDKPELYREFLDALRAASATGSLIRHSGRFPFTGRGDINTYAIFAELCRDLLNQSGRVGTVLPSGIAFADTTKLFFDDIVQSHSIVSLFSFFEIRKIFPATDSREPFCLLTLTGSVQKTAEAEFVFNAVSVADIHRVEKRFTLSPCDIELLNPNTKTCPIFQSRQDAELTKAIYRRVPILWREATPDRSAENHWRLSFKTLFHMANDSHHFRTAGELQEDGYRREGNLFVSPYDRYLPLYEAKMLHQFDHRWATYETASDSRDVTTEEKSDPGFVVQPRYWVREEVVESAIPSYPEPLAQALQIGHRPSIQRVLCWWVAGYYLNRSNQEAAQELFNAAIRFDLDPAVARSFDEGRETSSAAEIEAKFQLREEDIEAIIEQLDVPEEISLTLLQRFSPKWFLGWRDICRSTDERTIISSITPKAPIGHTFPLALSPGLPPSVYAILLATLNSFAADYVARQKVGGTHITYNLLKQFAVIPPEWWQDSNLYTVQWALPRVLELVYVAHDLEVLARECGYYGPPFPWDEERRFEIRCELDAAFFHLYLPSEATGDWQMVGGETLEQLADLRRHFPTPRHAAAFILDQFSIVREKDEWVYGRFRTKERILEIYDTMQAAKHTGQLYQSTLNPPPGTR